MHRRSRWRIATVLGALAAAFLPLDVLLGMLGLTLLDRAEGRVPQDIEDLDREFRVAHPYYSHDLVPNFDGFAQWGPTRYAMRTNSLGFRDSYARQVPVSADERRILFIGDSFTEGLGVDYESSFAGLLAGTLAATGIELLNAAVVTYSPAIYWKKIEYLVTRRLVQFDAVVVFLDISDIQDEALYYQIDDEGHVAEMPERPMDAFGTWRRHSFTYRAVERTVQRLHPHPPWIGCTNAEANRPICRSAWTLSGVAMDRYGREGLIRADRHMTHLAELLRAEGIPLTIVVYPPGTSLLQAPFVAVAGWRAAAWVSILSLTLTVGLLGCWLRRSGHSPACALLFVAYAPTLVMGRLATSDLPSAAVVTLGFWLFWDAGQRWRYLLAGTVAGVSFLFRETNLALFLPFIIGAAWRRDRAWITLTAGFAAGLAIALAIRSALMGTAVDWSSTAQWSFASALDSGPLYALALLVLLPGGLIAVYIYRGPRRQELQAAVICFVVIYLFYGYSGEDSGRLERVAAAGRYFIPVVPLITFAWAEGLSRHVRNTRQTRTWYFHVAAAGTLGVAFAVHPVMRAWSSRDAAVARDIVSTTDGGVVIADRTQHKFVAAYEEPSARLWMLDVPPARLAQLVVEPRPAYIVWVSRYETALMEELWAAPGGYVERTQRSCDLTPVIDRMYGSDRRLRIWRVRVCG